MPVDPAQYGAPDQLVRARTMNENRPFRVPLGVLIYAGGIVLAAVGSPLGPGLITLGIGVEIGRREL